LVFILEVGVLVCQLSIHQIACLDLPSQILSLKFVLSPQSVHRLLVLYLDHLQLVTLLLLILVQRLLLECSLLQELTLVKVSLVMQLVHLCIQLPV
jgi:hypothetical protein